MMTFSPPVQQELSDVPAMLQAIERTAETVADGGPALRAEIDAAYAQITNYSGNATAEWRAKCTRLTDKLLALRERLMYSYFGPREEQLLEGVLEELHELLQLQAPNSK